MVSILRNREVTMRLSSPCSELLLLEVVDSKVWGSVIPCYVPGLVSDFVNKHTFHARKQPLLGTRFPTMCNGIILNSHFPY